MNEKRNTVISVLIRGVFVILPVFIVGLAVVKMIQALSSLIQPGLDACPEIIFHTPALRVALGVTLIVSLFLVVGYLSQLSIGKTVGRWIERFFLNRIPLYPLLRRISLGMAGEDHEDAMKPVMVEVNPGIRQLGFVVERHGNGRSTIFLPSSPNTGSGSVMVVESSLVTDVNVPGHKVLSCLHQWGAGISKLNIKETAMKGSVT